MRFTAEGTYRGHRVRVEWADGRLASSPPLLTTSWRLGKACPTPSLASALGRSTSTTRARSVAALSNLLDGARFEGADFGTVPPDAVA